MTPLPSTLPWTACIDGPDLVVSSVKATCFGGRYDQGDNGQTESGIPNLDNPEFLVALPIRSTEQATRQSPLAFRGPHIPWGTPVRVWRASEGEDSGVIARLADNGPDVSRFPEHALDFNPPLALHFARGFDPKKLADLWSGDGFSYRILGGAKWVS